MQRGPPGGPPQQGYQNQGGFNNQGGQNPVYIRDRRDSGPGFGTGLLVGGGLGLMAGKTHHSTLFIGFLMEDDFKAPFTDFLENKWQIAHRIDLLD